VIADRRFGVVTVLGVTEGNLDGYLHRAVPTQTRRLDNANEGDFVATEPLAAVGQFAAIHSMAPPGNIN
jgi:hypothetical protein